MSPESSRVTRQCSHVCWSSVWLGLGMCKQRALRLHPQGLSWACAEVGKETRPADRDQGPPQQEQERWGQSGPSLSRPTEHGTWTRSAPKPTTGHHPCLHWRLLDTHMQVWVSLCSFLLGPGAHKVLFVSSKSLFPQSCVSSGSSMVGLIAPSSKRAPQWRLAGEEGFGKLCSPV